MNALLNCFPEKMLISSMLFLCMTAGNLFSATPETSKTPQKQDASTGHSTLAINEDLCRNYSIYCQKLRNIAQKLRPSSSLPETRLEEPALGHWNIGALLDRQ